MSDDPIELVLAKQANDAIAQGADPQAVTGRLHDMVAHLRANPDVAKMGADALSQGADPAAVSNRVYQLSQGGFRGAGVGRDFGDEPQPTDFAKYAAGSVPFVVKGASMLEGELNNLGDKAKHAVTNLLPHSAEQPNPEPPGLMANYNRTFESKEAGREEYRSNNPKKAFTAAVVGNAVPALATLGTSALEGAAPTAAEAATAAARGLGSKILRGIGVGTATGAVQGVSEGHGSVGDYIDKVEKNALLGGAVGGAAPLVTGAAGSVLKRINAPDMIAKGAERVGLTRIANAIGTKGKAADAIAQRAESDANAGFVPKAPTAGVPALSLDQAGPDVQGLAEGIASRPGPGRSKIIGRITERQQQMRPSVTRALEEGTGVPAGKGLAPLESELATLKAKGDAAYRAAREATKGQAIESPTLAEIQNTDIGQDAYRWAIARRGELGELPTSKTPTADLTKLTAMGVPEAKAAAALGDKAYDTKELPDPETLHLMKRFLYQAANGKMPGANTKQAAEAAGALQQWGKIRDELPDAWKQADDIYAQYAKHVEASNTGRNVFKTRINPGAVNPRKAVAQSLGKLQGKVAESSPEEQQATQQGAGAAAHALFESAPTSVKSPGRIFARSPERVQQTALAMKTPEAAEAFQKQVSAWDAIQEQANRLLGNSRTAARRAENAAATEMPSPVQAIRHPIRAIGSVVKGNDAAKQRIAREKLDAAIADFLTGPDISSIPNAQMVSRLRRTLAARTPYIAPIALAGGATAR